MKIYKNFCNKSESKCDKEKILKILDKDTRDCNLDSDIRTLTEVLSDKGQRIQRRHDFSY